MMLCKVFNIFEIIWKYIEMNIIENIISGIILAFLFVLFKELKQPDITGSWYIETYTDETSYPKYKNMTLGYRVFIWRSGNKIKGTREKIYEKLDKDEKKVYDSREITRGDLEGSLEQNYLPFTKSRLYLHVVEKGKERETTDFFTIYIKSNKYLEGNFKSSSADQEGTTKWQREKFS